MVAGYRLGVFILTILLMLLLPEPVQHEDSDNVDRANVKRNQVVVTITKADWKVSCRRFETVVVRSRLLGPRGRYRGEVLLGVGGVLF